MQGRNWCLMILLSPLASWHYHTEDSYIPSKGKRSLKSTGLLPICGKATRHQESRQHLMNGTMNGGELLES